MIAKLKNSLTAKIFVITCLLLMVVCALTYGFIAWVMPMTYTADRNQALTAAAEELAEELGQHTLADCDELLAGFAVQYDAEVSLLDGTGRLIKTTAAATPPSAEEMDLGRVQISGVQNGAGQEAISVADDGSANVMQAIGVSFSFAGSNEIDQLMVVGNMEAINQAAQALERIWPWLVGAILLISVFSAAFYARFITRPIVRLSGIARKMSQLDFGWQCQEARTDEIGTLARSLNELAEKLSAALAELQKANAALQADIERERALERQRLAFFAAASHELKTPLTVIKGQLGGMLDGVGTYADRDKYLARSLMVVRQMEGLVQELLSISRLETAQTALQKRPVELGRLVRACAEEYADLFAQKDQHLDHFGEEQLWVAGDPQLLAKVIRNLLANAAFYSPEEAEISVTLKRQQGAAVVTITNTGVQIPEEALAHLFEAFYRVDPSRSRQTGGSGLGLYLVQMILALHGAECQITNTAEGVCAVVRFPDDVM